MDLLFDHNEILEGITSVNYNEKIIWNFDSKFDFDRDGRG